MPPFSTAQVFLFTTGCPVSLSVGGTQYPRQHSCVCAQVPLNRLEVHVKTLDVESLLTADLLCTSKNSIEYLARDQCLMTQEEEGEGG